MPAGRNSVVIGVHKAARPGLTALRARKAWVSHAGAPPCASSAALAKRARPIPATSSAVRSAHTWTRSTGLASKKCLTALRIVRCWCGRERAEQAGDGVSLEWVTTRVPGLELMRTYERRWLPKDLVAGLVLTALLVPQGMAYAELAGLPPITGLYTSILCLAGYAALGPSRILVLGPDSSLGPMIAATILPLIGANGDPARAVELASMLAILVGAVMIRAGMARRGFVADLLSKPTQIGYMTGLALTILIGQLPKLFGFSVSSDTLIGDVTGFVDGVRSGETVTAVIIIVLFELEAILVVLRC